LIMASPLAQPSQREDQFAFHRLGHRPVLAAAVDAV
jgi:hypothetical protein